MTNPTSCTKARIFQVVVQVRVKDYDRYMYYLTFITEEPKGRNA